MARSRNIKPGFFRNADLVELPFEARLLFIGLWTIADRAGRLEDRPKQIKMELFPADNMDCDVLLKQLADIGVIERYEANGKRYMQVVNFGKHQNPHKDEKQSTIPSNDGEEENAIEDQGQQSANIMHAQCKHGATSEVVVLIPDSLVPSSDADASVVARNSLAQCPHQEIISLFAEQLPELSQPRVWNGAREKNLANRWKWVLADQKKKGKPSDKEAGLEFFRRMFAYVAKCDFLMGKKKDWSCSLPWIVEAENFAKIIEGNFEPKEAA
ncbi:MAG: hypothetical protein KAX99_04255 [Azonexus sp.]|jgi:hypothetical protein|nr:hypothetical protein [Azonexus sp.]